MDFEISGSLVLLISILIVVLTVVMIISVKAVYRRRSESNLTAKHASTTFGSPLEGRNKYPEVDTFSLGGTFRNYGVLASIILMILAFSWTHLMKRLRWKRLVRRSHHHHHHHHHHL